MGTVLVTGASSGIGKATVEHFVGRGWNVVATMRTPDGDRGDRVLQARLDVTEPASIEAAVAAGLERFGTINAAINNAGYGQYGIFESVPAEAVVHQFEVNVFGPMAVMRAVLSHMRAARSGVIVNVSSGAALYGLPQASVYCASKYALAGFTEAISYEAAAVGVKVCSVIPHGGVAGTAFPGKDATLALPPEEYQAYATRAAEAMAEGPAPVPIAAETVAETIYAAVTDGTNKLRYLVGNDTRGFIEAWQHMPQEVFTEFMRSKL